VPSQALVLTQKQLLCPSAQPGVLAPGLGRVQWRAQAVAFPHVGALVPPQGHLQELVLKLTRAQAQLSLPAEPAWQLQAQAQRQSQVQAQLQA